MAEQIIEAEFIEEPQRPLARETTIVVHVDGARLVSELANAPQAIAAHLLGKVARRIPERGAPLPRNGGSR